MEGSLSLSTKDFWERGEEYNNVSLGKDDFKMFIKEFKLNHGVAAFMGSSLWYSKLRADLLS